MYWKTVSGGPPPPHLLKHIQLCVWVEKWLYTAKTLSGAKYTKYSDDTYPEDFVN